MDVDFIILCLEDELKRTFPLKHVQYLFSTVEDIKTRIRDVIKELKEDV